MENLRILVPADPELYNWIDQLAREEERPRTAIVRRLLRAARARALSAAGQGGQAPYVAVAHASATPPPAQSNSGEFGNAAATAGA
jgi:hypothetical protein